MIKSILLGLDGSAYGASAAELGRRWARRFNALLVGLGVVDAPDIRRPELVPVGAAAYKEHRDDVLVARSHRRVEDALERFAFEALEAGVTAQLLERVGHPSEQILREAPRYDLILLGQRTYFHPETSDAPCETLWHALRHTPRPVVAAPRTLNGGRATVVAYDGSLPAARVLQAFEASGLGAGGDVHVVGAGGEREEVSGHVERAAAFLRSHGLDVHAHPVVTTAPPAGVILERVRQTGPACW